MNEFLSRIGPWLWMIGIPVIFLVIAAWVFRPGARQKYRHDANIPFEKDDSKHD